MSRPVRCALSSPGEPLAPEQSDLSGVVFPVNSISGTRFVDSDSESEIVSEGASLSQSDSSTSFDEVSALWRDNPTFRCHWLTCSHSYSSGKALQKHVHTNHILGIDPSNRQTNSNWLNSLNCYLAGCNLVVCAGNTLVPSGCSHLRLYQNKSNSTPMCQDCLQHCRANSIALPASGNFRAGRATKNSALVVPDSQPPLLSMRLTRANSLIARSVTLVSSSDGSGSSGSGGSSEAGIFSGSGSGSLSRSSSVLSLQSGSASASSSGFVFAAPADQMAASDEFNSPLSIDDTLPVIPPLPLVPFPAAAGAPPSVGPSPLVNAIHVDRNSNTIKIGSIILTFDDLLRISSGPIHSIPNPVVLQISVIFGGLIRAINLQLPDAEFHYQIFSAVMFSSSPRKNVSLKSVMEHRLNLWNACDIENFLHTVPNKSFRSPSSVADEHHRLQKTIRTLINSDECSKAFSRLTSNLGIAEENDINFGKLSEKFSGLNVPKLRTEHLVHNPSDGHIVVTPDIVLKSLKKMPNSAAGPDGITSAVLKQLVKSCGDLIQDLTGFINHCFAFHFSSSVGVIINAAKLIGLWKDEAKSDVRPITIGNSLRRLTARCALPYVLPLAETAFGKDQFGAGTPNGTEKPIHILRTLMQTSLNSQDDFIVMSRDAKNAFNEIDQNVVFDGVIECMPKLANYLRFVYGSNAPQMFGSIGKLFMNAGVFQGDPLSALLFCFVPRKIWSTLESQAELSGVPIEWNRISKLLYMDDTFIAGPSKQVFAIAKSMAEVGAPLGLIAVPKKDQLCRPNPLAASDNSALPLLDHLFDSDGNFVGNVPLPPGCSIKFSNGDSSMLEMPNCIKMLGSFVAPVRSVLHPDVDESTLVHFVNVLVNETITTHSHLRKVDAFHDRLTLLRVCANSMGMIGHLARTIPAHILDVALIHAVDRSALQLVSEMLQGPRDHFMSLDELQDLHPFAASFFDSSLQDGGLGLRRIQHYRSAAMIASVSATLSSTKSYLADKLIGAIRVANSVTFDSIQTDLISSSVNEFNRVCNFAVTAPFIKDNAKNQSRYIPRSALSVTDISYGVLKSVALGSDTNVMFQQRVLCRTIDLALRCDLMQRATDHVPVDQGYALMRLQHIDSNSVLFLQAKPNPHAGTFLANQTISYGLQFYTDTLSSFAFHGMTMCAHTLKPIDRHSVVWCQKAGQNVQRHEDLVHSITKAINLSPNNHVAVANVNLAYSNPRAGASNSNSGRSAEPQVLKPADIFVNGRDLIDVTVVDPRTKAAVRAKYYENPSRVFKDVIHDKQLKYQDVILRDNRCFNVFTFSHFGMPHYFVLKTLKRLLYSPAGLATRNKCSSDLYQLRVQMSLIFFLRAGIAVENHLRPLQLNVQPELMQQLLENRLGHRRQVTFNPLSASQQV